MALHSTSLESHLPFIPTKPSTSHQRFNHHQQVPTMKLTIFLALFALTFAAAEAVDKRGAVRKCASATGTLACTLSRRRDAPSGAAALIRGSNRMDREDIWMLYAKGRGASSDLGKSLSNVNGYLYRSRKSHPILAPQFGSAEPILQMALLPAHAGMQKARRS
ncbi:hypothetical protein CC80DRAFT_555224 [Byssothecium circinans]|uniref:Uncharacterized protein n=1 Tax=Byssothecium circinans TaxID=147558 RepID=A0A6A5TCV7_9PLEO|nr:hypothetical protein CC80DRAFT_555224 [Byssothecium circinans]